MKTIALIGTFDTKGDEFYYVKGVLEHLGNKVLTINTGAFSPKFTPDIEMSEVALEVGETADTVRKADRAQATAILSKGVEKLLPKLFKTGKFDGVLSFGGSGGTSIVTPGMRQLPIGVPKIMVSTMASGDTSAYVGSSDVIMMPSIVDVSGLNKLSITIFQNAAAAISGMVNAQFKEVKDSKPLIAATMFGVTTPAVDTARKYLEDKGYEVLVFHATGTGGKAMENLVTSNYFEGVLDLTTTELADELVGGVLSAGSHRLEAASKKEIPQVVSVGALDMVNFGAYETVPEKFKTRNLYKHNPTVTLMRTTVEENKKLGEIIAAKLNLAKKKTILMLPLKGVSQIDQVNGPFYGSKEDEALFKAIKENLNNPQVEIIEENNNINDESFAIEAAQQLLNLIEGKN